MTQRNQDKFEQAANILFSARTNALPIDSLPQPLQPATINESYQLQEHLNRKLAATHLQEVIGYKIGCTTTVMQEYLGIEHPCKGAVFQSTTHFGQGKFNWNTLCRPGVECEIAVQLAQDMPPGQVYVAGNCDAFVESTMCSIELVDDRWTDYRKVSTPSLIAENFFGAGCVFGKPAKVSGEELQKIRGTLRVNGKDIGSGQGSDILGHPYEALAWLANHQVQRGTLLAAGDYVSLGSVVQTYWLDRNDRVEIEFSQLGSCSLQLV